MIVTAIDHSYLPGVRALANSIRKNSPNHRLHCFAYGEVNALHDCGVQPWPPPEMPGLLPGGEGTAPGNHPMYVRLMAPLWFRREERVIWMDADQVVLAPLDELYEMQFEEVCACVPSRSLREQVKGAEVPDVKGIYSGLIVFNVAAWIRERITERCFEYMNARDGAEYPYVVQSVLARVLAGNFHHLHQKWQGFANRKHVPDDSVVLHWHGRGPTDKPWLNPAMNHAEKWRAYA